MELEELNVYKISMELGETVCDIVENLDYFPKKTLGVQLVRSADSIAANISEGFGRYHFKESINFYYYARGSLFETRTWLTKANNRKLISQNEYELLIALLKNLSVKLNNFIKSIGK